VLRTLQHVGSDAILMTFVRDHFWVEAGADRGNGTGAFHFLL